MKKKLLNFLVVLLLLGSAAYAQSRRITGKVTSAEDGSPLPGVSIRLQGTNVGTQTTSNGDYSIAVPTGPQTLIFSYVGSITQTVKVGASGTLNVKMASDPKVLSEVSIVVPFGTAKKETFTGSATVISSKDIANRPVTNVLNALSGASPGVSVSSANGQPGSAPSVRIRGIGSINASNNPLYVVDGIQYENAIANLNSDDVESISVLKDASSTALYGAKAANGVIIITTKKGKRNSSQTNIKVTEGYSARGIPEYSRVDAYQYYPLEWQALRNGLAYAATNPLSLANASIIASGLGTRNANNQQIIGTATYLDIAQTLGNLVVGGVYKASNNPFNVPSNQIVDVNGKINPNAQLRYDDLDWFKPLEQPSLRSNYALNYSGGSDKNDYYVSVDYTKEKGYIIKSDYQRLTARLNINHQATSWFKTGVNVSGTITQSNAAADGSSTGYVNPFFFARNIGPVYNVYAHNPTTGALLYDALGAPVYDTGGLTALGVPGRASGASPGRHILEETLLNNNLFKRNVLGVRTYGEITFLKDFKFTTNLGGDLSNNYGSTFDNQVIGDGAPGGRASKTNTLATSLNLQELLNYNHAFGSHHVNVLLGHESYARQTDGLTGSRSILIATGITDLANFTTTTNLSSATDKDRTEGYFSRVNYDFNEKYLLSGSFRLDKSSRFAANVRDGYYGGVGAGWRIDKEEFLKDVRWINQLKLRGSYGTVGNYLTLDANGNSSLYPYQSLYNLNNNALEPGFIESTTVGNPDITWEVNKSSDVAIEYSLFNNRLFGSVEFYNRVSSNLLFLVPLPVSSGVANQFQNIGSMYNRGFEINIGGEPIRTRNFTWSVNLNAATLQNKITKMPPTQPEIVSGTKKLAVGHSVYDFYLRSYQGVDPTDGSALYIPTDGLTGTTVRTINGVNYTTSQSNAKLDYTGDSSIPKVQGSLNNSFTYKNLTLSFLVNYSLGGKIYDSNYASLMSVTSYGGALSTDMLKAWMNPGDITNIPRIDNTNAANLYAASSRWLTNASYLAFRNATLNYKLPSSVASKLFVKGVNVFASGENLFVISGRKGLDPTQSFNGTTANSYIPSRILTLGLNVSLQ
jgi:TonB-linked SusC/RagA family outer membrane protein